MKIIAHRGFWHKASKKNKLESFNNALANNFGIETDTPLVRRNSMRLHLKIVDILIRYLKLDVIYFYTIVRPILFIKNPKKYLKKILKVK